MDQKPPTGAAEEDTKEGVTDKNLINIRVLAQDNVEVHFKIKRTTPMRKLISAYCERQGVQSTSVRFLFDGEQVDPEETPEGLEMEDNDTIDIMQQQTGGC